MSAGDTCKECGTAVPADAGGWCLQCLLRLGLHKEIAGESGMHHAAVATQSVGRRKSESKDTDSKTSDAPLTDEPNDRIGRYRLLEEIGHGGCGVVYMAEQEEPVRRKVALKVIKLGMDTKQVVARFEAERQALALMDHPNISKVLDAGATQTGRPYFVMELVGGIRMTDFCDQNHLTIRERLDLFIQVCRAVQHAHQKGVIHRDIKPSNVLVATQDGVPVPKVIDFGIAKATQGRLTDQTMFTAFEQFLGTPAYMSPEQAQLGGLDVDTRSDIYSLGVLLYELLTGKTPFDSKELLSAGLEAMRRTIQEKEAPPPSTRLKQELASQLVQAPNKAIARNPKIGRDLDCIVMKCLEKDRSRRYDTANGLARDIERHLNNEPVVASPPSRIYNLQKLYRRNRLVVSATALIILVGMLGGGGILWQWGSARQHARLEHQERKRAERASERALATLARMEAIEVRRAEEYYEAGDRGNMLTYLALILRQNPSNRVAAERLFSTLSHRHWSRLACPPLLHSNRVTSAMFSRDGRWVVTSAADNTARVWDANSGQIVAGPFRHNAEVNTAEFSPDGHFVVTASDDFTARVWDARTGLPVTEAIPHSAQVKLARFSPDGQIFITLCDDRTARLWDAHTGRSICPALTHGNEPPKGNFFREAAFSPNGALVATACREKGIVRVWSCSTGEMIDKLEYGDSETSCVRFSIDGQRLAIAYCTNTALIWTVGSSPPQSLSLPQDGKLLSIEFSPDGQRVVTASSGGTAQVWDIEHGKPIGPPLHHAGPIACATFSPEGLRVVTASSDRTIRVWDAETGAAMTEPMTVENGAYYAQFHPDGQRVLTVSNGRAVLIWCVGGAESFGLHEKFKISNFNFSHHNSTIVICGEQGCIEICEPFTGRPVTPLSGLTDEVCSAAFSADDRYVVAGSAYGWAQMWSALTAHPLGKSFKGGVPGMDVAVQFSPENERVLTASIGGAAQVWETLSGRSVSPPFGDSVMDAQFSPNGKWVVTGSSDHTARIWNSANGQPVGAIMKHEGPVLAVQFSPDSRHLLTGSSDRTARLWAVPAGTPLSPPFPHSLPPGTLRFSPDGGRFLSAMPARPSVHIWDSANFALLAEISTDDATLAEFSPDGRSIVTGSRLGTVQIWDSRTGARLSEPLAQHAWVHSLQLSPDGRFLGTVCNNGVVTFWEVAPAPLPVSDWLPELAEALAGQRFNQEGLIQTISPEQLWIAQQKLTAAARVGHPNDHGDATYSSWAKWFISPPSSRTVLPSTSVRLQEQIESWVRLAGTEAACKEALLLLPTNASAMAAFGARSTNPGQADWLTQRALEQAPMEADVLWARQNVLRRSGRFAETFELLKQHPTLHSYLPWIWRDKGQMFEKLEQLEEALKAYSEGISSARVTDPQLTAYELAIRKEVLSGLLVERRRVLKRLNRMPEAMADIMAGKHIPGRAPRVGYSRFTPIDLRRQINQSLEDFNIARTMGATNSMASVKCFGGVEFELSGYILLLPGDADPCFPRSAQGIEVGQKCHALHFLHTCTPASGLNTGPVAAYVVHYVGGAQEEIPIVDGENVRTWSDTQGPLSGASDAWVGKTDDDQLVRLIKFSWQNPRPEVRIQSLDFIVKGDFVNPSLFAITAEE
jgi:WD40 repeat protein/serine/threonine protein kinase